jgi:hypothetical protein
MIFQSLHNRRGNLVPVGPKVAQTAAKSFAVGEIAGSNAVDANYDFRLCAGVLEL